MVNVDLVNLTTEVIDLLAKSGSAFESAHNARFGENHNLAIILAEDVRRDLTAQPAGPKWGYYLAVDRTTRVMIGAGGFKGSPDAAGAVRIGCFAFPEFEGQGYSTAIARELVKIAAASGMVTRVLLDTAAKRDSSTIVMGKLGFVLQAEVEDKGEKRWRWEKEVGKKSEQNSC